MHFQHLSKSDGFDLIPHFLIKRMPLRDKKNVLPQNISTIRQKTIRSGENQCRWKVAIVSPWNAWPQLWNKNRCGVYCIPKSLKDKANKQDCWLVKTGKSTRKPEGDKPNTSYLELYSKDQLKTWLWQIWKETMFSSHQRLIRISEVPENKPQHLWRKHHNHHSSLHSEQPVLISQQCPIPEWRRRCWKPQVSRYVKSWMTK